jgi:hypothetical protein
MISSIKDAACGGVSSHKNIVRDIIVKKLWQKGAQKAKNGLK